MTKEFHPWRSMALFLLALLFASISISAETLPKSLYHGMRWRLIGPFRGGRVETVAGIPGNPLVYYFGSVAGGVWKTTNGGKTWLPIFDKEPVASIGAIAVAPSDPNVIYVGTGEPCPRGDIAFGDGIYKSTDGGKTWLHLGLGDTRHITTIIVDPRNPDVVYVSALGHVYGANAERGVFRSENGGKTWQKVLYKNENTGAVDLAMDPNNPRILFAALWQVKRTPWSLVSGGPGSGLYKSTDGGDTWTHLEGHGLPEGVLGRIGVTVAANSNRIYAIIETKNGGLYRSDDGGATWTLMNASWELRGRPWYYSHIFADPGNPNEVYVFSFGAYRSVDGGKTFSSIITPHGDYHALWIDPHNPSRMIIGNDGGATISTNHGRSWTTEDNQPTGQFYRIATDNRFNYYLYGSQQDRGTVAITSRSDRPTIGQKDWYSVGGGESGFVLPSPLDPDIVYAGSLYSDFTVFDKKSGRTRDISPWPFNELSLPAKDTKYRFGWTAPMLISAHAPHTLYIGAQVLFKTTDNGSTWSVISPDLTRNDKSKQKSSGGPITQDNTTVEYYDMISTIAESPVRAGLIWVGTDDGLIQLTRDDGTTWKKVTPKQMPEWSNVAMIEASPFSASTAYAAVDAHRLDDFRPYIYRTTDFGKTWTEISTGLPTDSYVHVVREDPKGRGLLYAGTETGIYVSFDDGDHWQSLQLNLPRTPIYDLAIHGNDLAVATHGRAFWILDDLTPLRHAKEALAVGGPYLYRPEAAYRVTGNNYYAVVFSGAPSSPLAGQNPPPGAVLDYFLPKIPSGPVQIEILNPKGNLVQKFVARAATQETGRGKQTMIVAGGFSRADGNEFSNRPTVHAGQNRFVWDMRYVGGSKQPKSMRGYDPFVMPGSYTVRLTVDGKSESRSLDIREDPRVHVTTADLRKQFDLEIKIRDSLRRADKAVSEMKQVHTQLAALHKRLEASGGSANVVKDVEALDTKTIAEEKAITGWKVKPDRYSLNYPPALDGQLAWLFRFTAQGDGAPGQPFYVVFKQLNRQLDKDLQDWQEIKTTDLRQLNQLIRRKNIPAVAP